MKPAIKSSQIFALAVLSVFCVFALALAWEYGLEPGINRAFSLPNYDSTLIGLRLQFIGQATLFAALGMLPSIYISLKMARALRGALATETAARRAAEAAAEAKMRFLANMSHELRTPLNAIIGFSELAQINKDSEKCHEYAQIVCTAGGHLLAVVNDILDIAKSDSDGLQLSPQSVDLDRLLRETAFTFSAQADKADVSLDLAAPASAVPVIAWADEQRTRQAVYNLVSNAIKFTPAGGHVWIRAERHGAETTITIRDSGIGIRSEDIDRMFHPFEQADNSFSRKFEGTGLGLSLARRFARAMGGNLTLTSASGKGTCATLQLPSAKDVTMPLPTPAAA